jgi:hypothetical protein
MFALDKPAHCNGAQIGDNVFVACLESFDARPLEREPKPWSVLA